MTYTEELTAADRGWLQLRWISVNKTEETGEIGDII